MNILIIQPYSYICGPSQVMYQFARQLHGEHYHFSVIMPKDGPAAEQFRSLGIEVTYISEATALHRTVNPLQLILFALRLIVSVTKVRAYIQARRIDLVHSTTAQCLVGGCAARLAGIPSIYHVHDLTLATPKIVGYIMSRIIALTGDRIIFVSEAVRRSFSLPSGEKHKTQVVFNGVDTREFCPGLPKEEIFREFDIDIGQPIVMTVGTLEKRKGQDLLMRAAARVCQSIPNPCFLIIGEVHPYSKKNGYEAEIKQLVIDFGLSKNVIFAGPRGNVSQLLRKADVFVQPSRVEAAGIALLEAMASGIPVIGMDTGGIPEEVVNEVTGLLVPPLNSDALADAIIYLLRDEQCRKRMGTAGRLRVEQFFDIRKKSEAMASIYDDLIPDK